MSEEDLNIQEVIKRFEIAKGLVLSVAAMKKGLGEIARLEAKLPTHLREKLVANGVKPIDVKKETEFISRLETFTLEVVENVKASVVVKKQENFRRKPLPIKATFLSFCAICVRNAETRNLILDILHNHDEQRLCCINQ